VNSRLPSVLTWLLLISSTVFSQTYTISTYAGAGPADNIPGTSVSLGNITAVAVDRSGNAFLCIKDYGLVLRWDAATGVISRFAGTGIVGFSGDNGPATSAQLLAPTGIVVDYLDNIYILDQFRIRKVSKGVITTLGGGATPDYSGDNGPVANARFSDLRCIVADIAGNLYILDAIWVRKVSNGVIKTVAGTYEGSNPFFIGDNGPATGGVLSGPEAIALDSAGNLYIADTQHHRIRKVANGIITSIAGTGEPGYSGDGDVAAKARLLLPSGIAVDSTGVIYIADTGNNRIRKISNNGIFTVSGTNFQTYSGDNGPAENASLNYPKSIAVDLFGRLYIADTQNERLRRISNGVITTLAGNGAVGYGGDGGPALYAQFFTPHKLAVDNQDNLYISDSFDGRIRRISNGLITTVAGNGKEGPSSGDNGPAFLAQLLPAQMTVDSSGTIYVEDGFNYRIRKISNGVITTVVGTGVQGFSGDNGPATSAQIGDVGGMAVDSAGNLYFSDPENYRIRKVSDGIITTVAGNGNSGFSSDIGSALSQAMTPYSLAIDTQGNLYFIDGNRVRKMSHGIVTTVAGNGTAGFSGDFGPPDAAQLSPGSIALDRFGNLFIADVQSFRVRKVSNGIITTIAGTGSRGFTGDNGPATSAQLNPYDIAVDSLGSVYLSDPIDHRIRILRPQPFLNMSPSPLQSLALGQLGATYSITVTNQGGAGISTGNVTLTSVLSSGLTLVSMSGEGWKCASNNCSRSDVLAGGASYPAVTINVNVWSDAPPSVTNQVTLSIGGAPQSNLTYTTPVVAPPPPLFAFFSGQEPRNSGLFLAFPNGLAFGYFSYLSGNWIFHADLGYELVIPADDKGTSIYLWDLKAGHLFFTNRSVFPLLFDTTLNAWLYYNVDPANPGHYTTNPRIFTNLLTGQIIQM
jgi:uncharacterized repeat protein (TIGR01451 family)